MFKHLTQSKTLNKTFYISHQNQKIAIYLKKSSKRKKTITLKIDKSQNITLLAPISVSDQSIQKFISCKKPWLLKKIEEQTSLPPIPTYHLKNGEKYHFLGKEVYLQLIYQANPKKTHIKLQYPYLEITTHKMPTSPQNKKYLKKQLFNFYKEQAKKIITPRINHYAQKMELKNFQLSIKKQKTRWGSCNNHGHITINWRSIMTPLEILDYIIVHELAHLKEMNHSSKFWHWVSTILPDYQQHRKKLRTTENKYIDFCYE